VVDTVNSTNVLFFVKVTLTLSSRLSVDVIFDNVKIVGN